MFLILHLKMRKVFLLPNVWKEGLLKLTITIGLQFLACAFHILS